MSIPNPTLFISHPSIIPKSTADTVNITLTIADTINDNMTECTAELSSILLSVCPIHLD